jgi:hypothetical protein
MVSGFGSKDSASLGWAKIDGSPKWHFVRDGKSLCGRWMYLGRNKLDLGNDDSADNCAACRRKVAKLYFKGSENLEAGIQIA